MLPRQASPTFPLALHSVTVFLAMLAVLLLGPLLVELAKEFNTSVAAAGQPGGATAIAWGIAPPLARPVSDAYGRGRLTRLMLLASGMLGAALAWN